MIEESEDGGYRVYCDHCHHSDEVDEDSWSAMIDYIKSEGWRITKRDGEWVHTCPYCITER